MEWHPDYLAEFKRRTALAWKLRHDPYMQAAFRVYYAHHTKDFIRDWGITYDPRAPLKIMPFLLFPRQEEFIDFLDSCVADGENGLVEKSRDMGVTWECVVFAAKRWLFNGATAIGFGSRKRELVDRIGDPDSIFEKIRMQLSYTPDFFLPPSFSLDRHSSLMRIINPATKATITGEIGDSIGRGGRKEIYFKDESAHYEHPELIEAALGDNTNVQVDVSSVNGSGNIFYRRRMAGEVWSPGCVPTPGKTRIFIFDWRDNPLKSQAWYDLRRKRAEEEGLLHIFAQEVDRDYSGSIDNNIIKAEWVRSAIDAHIKLGFDDSAAMSEAASDVADGGGDKNALAIKKFVILRHIDHWPGEADEGPAKILPLLLEHGVRTLRYDSTGVGAGFKAGVNNLKRQETWPDKIKVRPWAGGGAVLWPEKNVIEGDRESPKNEDHYQNLKAQAHFMLRARFIKTHQAVNKIANHDPKDLISLDSRMPRLQELCMEFTQPIHKTSATGKVMVDKKPDGTMSPNMHDSVVILYCPDGKLGSFFSPAN